MDIPVKVPFYARIALIFIGLFAFVFTMHIGQHIILPILYATLMAILLNPLVNYLVRKKIKRVIAISIAVALTLILVSGILYVISTQASLFSETYPQLKEKVRLATAELVKWVSDNFRIKRLSINTWINETQSESIDDFEIGKQLSAVGQTLIIGMLLPVYIFLILYYKPLLLEFIRRLFQAEHRVAVEKVLTGTKKIIQTYLTGLVFEMIIVAVLNSAGLLLLGIDYAIILGIIGAVLNLIPYIGGVVGTLLPMTIAFVTKDSMSYPILVFCVYIFIQFIDNNFIIPKIVASRVQLNALTSIIAVLIGGALWGVSGMFLSIPLTAVIKIIFDHVEPLKPWGFLLGNIVPTTSRFAFGKRKKV
ncbi:MAG: yhhT [Bacteroidetes bacterium]|nr:MAG: yhhT [Bacteroidota bacterium]